MALIHPGERRTLEERERRARRKRGTVAKAKFAAADADFASFKNEMIREGDGLRIRAGELYAVYLKWRDKRLANMPKDSTFFPPAMSQRAFGIRIRRYFSVRKGQGGVVTYEGISGAL